MRHAIVLLAMMGFYFQACAEDVPGSYQVTVSVKTDPTLCQGHENFWVRCEPVDLGKDFKAATKSYAQHCHSGWKDLFATANCKCIERYPKYHEQNPKQIYKQEPAEISVSRNATPQVSMGMFLYQTFGPKYYAGFARFKDGKPLFEGADGVNINCDNADQFVPHEKRTQLEEPGTST